MRQSLPNRQSQGVRKVGATDAAAIAIAIGGGADAVVRVVGTAGMVVATAGVADADEGRTSTRCTQLSVPSETKPGCR